MKLKIEINCDNEAFRDNCREEVARILTALANDFPDFDIGYRASLRDINGNKVGHATVTET